MSCPITYFDWLASEYTAEQAGNLQFKSNGDMICTLKDGHEGEHHWRPADPKRQHRWSKPEKFFGTK